MPLAALLCALSGGVAQARLTRFESPATWQIYQDLVTYRKQLRLDPVCVHLAPRHSYETGELFFELQNDTDKSCRLYGPAGKVFGVASVNRRTFATRHDGYAPTLRGVSSIEEDTALTPLTPGRLVPGVSWDHPTLYQWRAFGVKVAWVEQVDNRLRKVFHVTLPQGMDLRTPQPFAKVADAVCRANAGWNFDVLSEATGELAQVRCHQSGALFISTLAMEHSGGPVGLYGTDDWDGRAGY